MKSYRIGVTNIDSNEFDNAAIVLEDSRSSLKAFFPDEIKSNFANFKLRTDKIATVIYYQDEKTSSGKTFLEFQKLKVFYGAVPLEVLRKAYNDATSGVFERKNPTTNGEQPDAEYSTPQDGLPIGSENGGLDFNLDKVPSIVWLIAAGYSALKLIDTNNPLYAAAGVYTFIQYRKKTPIKILP